MLRKVEVERDATVRRVPTCILGSKVKKLRNREVKLVKVQWGDDQGDATWETEDKIRASYPFLFERMFLTSPFSTVLFILVPSFSVSFRLYLRPLGRKSYGCKHVFETCYVWWMQVDVSVCSWMHLHTH